MMRTVTGALLTLSILTSTTALRSSPATADHNPALEQAAAGLAGLVSSATGYAMLSSDDLACLSHGHAPCTHLNAPERTRTAGGAEGLVASHVNLSAEG